MMRAVVHEIVGLFIDDGLLAVALVVWVGVIGLVRLVLGSAAPGLAVMFAVGCAVILLGSIVRAARQ